MQPSGVTQTSRHPKGEERDLHNDNMKQTTQKGRKHIYKSNRARASQNRKNQNTRNDPRGQGGRRGTRIRHPARLGRTTTALGGVSARRSSRTAVRTLCPHGFKPLLSLDDGLQPLHSCPIQAFGRPSIALPCLLALSRALSCPWRKACAYVASSLRSQSSSAFGR